MRDFYYTDQYVALQTLNVEVQDSHLKREVHFAHKCLFLKVTGTTSNGIELICATCDEERTNTIKPPRGFGLSERRILGVPFTHYRFTLEKEGLQR